MDRARSETWSRFLGGLLVFGIALFAFPPVLNAGIDGHEEAPSRCPLPEGIERPITHFLQALESEDYHAARISLGIVRERARAQGVGNLFPLSAAVRSWINRKGTPARTSEMLEILDGVVELAPDDPWIHWQRGRLVLMGLGLQGTGEAVWSFGESIRAFRRNPAASLEMVGRLAFPLLLALSTCLVLVSLGILIRRFTLLAHDVGDLFPRAPTSAFSLLEMARSRGLRFLVGSGVNRVLSGSLLVVILVFPVAAGAGLIPTACLWTLMLTPYLRPAERVGAGLSLIAVALIPWVAAWSLLPGRALLGDGAALWATLQGIPVAGAEDRVRRRSTDLPDDPWAALARTRMENRRAPLTLEILRGNRARLAAARRDPHGLVATEIGHTDVRLALAACKDGEPDREMAALARSSYQEALRQAPGRPEILEAIALASALAGDAAGTREALRAWTEASPEAELERVGAWKPLMNPQDACREALRLDRELRLPPLPAWHLYLLDQDPWAPVNALPFQAILVGRLPVPWLSVLGVAGLLMLLLVTGLRERLHTASSCPRCGTVSCASCNQAATGFDYCPTCLFDQVRPAFLDPGDRMAREWHGSSGLGRRAALVLGLLFPGLGQVLDGRPIRGTLLLLMLSGALVAVAVPVSPVVNPLFFAGVGRGLPVLPPLVLLTTYLLSALDLWRHRRS